MCGGCGKIPTRGLHRIVARVAELADALDLGSSGQPWGFDSPLSHQPLISHQRLCCWPLPFDNLRKKGPVMNVDIENVSSVKKKINFEIPSERVDAEIEKVYANIRKRAAIKGFRKGKVPQAIIEKHYREAMGEDVLKNLINETCYKAMYENKIIPIAAPVIDADQVEKGQSLKYSATVEVMPEIDVKDYEGLQATREQFAPEEGVVDARLKHMQETMAQLKPVAEKRPVQNGDFVTLDFVGYVDGVPFDNGAADDYQLEIGSGRFIPGFEEQIVGMEEGQEGAVKVTFPAEYGSEELAGKDAEFRITIKEIKAKELPALDDEFAKGCGDFETMADLRSKIAEMYEQQEKERIESDVKDRIVEGLIAKNDIEVPAAMVERQLEFMMENMKRRLASQGMSMEMMGIDPDTFRARYEEMAVKQVKGILLLDAVARKEKIEASEEDVEAKINEIAEQSGQPVDAVRNYYKKTEEARSNLRAQVKEEKTLAYLLDKAVVTEVPKEQAQ